LIARYSLSLRVVHWLTALLILAQVSLATLNILLYEPRPILAEWLVQAHISLGAVILTLAVCRVALRLRSPVPARPSSRTLRIASNCVHILLYVCLMILPVSGYLRLAALGFEIRLFGVLPLPALAPNIPLAKSASGFHDAAALVLGALLVMHITAAVFHKQLDGKAVLNHMAI